jgi:hypothetical protein
MKPELKEMLDKLQYKKEWEGSGAEAEFVKIKLRDDERDLKTETQIYMIDAIEQLTQAIKERTNGAND